MEIHGQGGKTIDWEHVHARLERIRTTLEARLHPSPEEAQRILSRRARALAAPLAEAPAPTEILSLLIFSLGGQRHGVETRFVREVMPLQGLTSVAGVPPVILGVVNHRGQILAVLDLRRPLHLTGEDSPERGRVLVVEAGNMKFGLFAESVEGLERVDARAVTPAPAIADSKHPGFLRGVTAGMVVVLDAEALAGDSRIVVNDGGG